LPAGPVAGLAAAVVVVGVLLALPEPARDAAAVPLSPTAVASPTFHGPPTADTPGVLADSTIYTPRMYLDPQTSVGLAATADAQSLRLLLRTGAKVVELRRLAVGQNPQFDGFAVSGDTLVWAETLGDSGTSLWRANWQSPTSPVMITDATGNATFAGSQYDVVISDGRVYWTAQPATGVTEVRSIPVDAVNDGDVDVRRLTGDFALSQWPWVVGHGGRGKPAQLRNLNTGQTLAVATAGDQNVTCTPTWCRLDTLATTGLKSIDVKRPDGSKSAHVAGAEATPAIADATVLDRYIPLLTDQPVGTGLSLYDLTTADTKLIAVNADNVRSAGSVLWWSTTSEDGVEWHAIDLSTLG
jgi:hypothetical protein